MSNDQQFVLSCIDGSKFSTAVCDYSAWIAKNAQVPLKLLHTIEHVNTALVADYSGAIGLGSSEELLHQLTEVEKSRSRLLIEQGTQMLATAKERAIKIGATDVITRQRHGSLAETLVELEQQIYVLVLGLRGESHQTDSASVGEQLESTIRSLHKPVLVVNGEFKQPEKIMLAYDDSEAAQKALSMVIEGPLFHNMPCDVVYVGDKSEQKQAMLDKVAQQLTFVGINVQTKILNGKTEQALADYQNQQNIDLMVMGAYSHNIVRDFLLGSFTAKMLQQTNTPLLLLR
jgi:nucleotide-binding universal stress UspA family protein